MTATTSRNSTPLRRGLQATLPGRRFALGVATGFVLGASLLAGCESDNYTGEGTLEVYKHLYLHSNGTKYEITEDKDASGKDVVTATPK